MGAIERTNPILGDRARQMRNEPTPFEKALWLRLGGSQLGGFKFRRQIVLAPWIVDFFCSAKGLIIEIDGNTHDAEADRRRDAILLQRGFHVLRFTNQDVGSNVDGVLERILAKVSALPDRFTHPPAPSLEREGER